MSTLDGIIASGGSGGVGGSGDVVGPASATDFGIAYFDDTTGKLLASSATTITAAGSLTIPSAETIEWSTDTGLARSAAGVVKATDGSTGYGNLEASQFRSMASGAIKVAMVPLASYGLTVSSDMRLTFWNNSDISSGGVGAALSSSGNNKIDATGVSSAVPAAILSAVWVEANTAGSGTPNAIAATESGTVFTNEGSGAKNYEALPTAVAGYQYTFIVQDADGMRIVANTGDTIRVIDKVTAAAGYIESTTIGSVVTLIAINATEWIATSIHGTWTDGTFTYDDTSLTTP